MTGQRPRPRRFVLRRRVDPSGVSGIGDVAEGIRWSDGTAAVRWLTGWPATTQYDQGVRAVEAVHGHGGTTVVMWLDGNSETPDASAGSHETDDAGGCSGADSDPPSDPGQAGTAWQRHDDPLVPLDPAQDYGDEQDAANRLNPLSPGPIDGGSGGAWWTSEGFADGSGR